ncbi:MAG: cation transporter [Gammaproteobacteria bacterium]|nr:MAG: cation transporter [Gammaproteobacteria bacterium]
MVKHTKQPQAVDNLVVHHLKLCRAKDDDVQRAIIDLGNRFPFDLVSFDEQRRVLNLAYDASRHNEQGVKVLLQEHHLSISHDWWTHSPDGYNWLIGHKRQGKLHH